MSKWNHRMWHEITPQGESIYTVRETFYNAAGNICATTMEAAKALGYTQGELVETLERMLKAAREQDALEEDKIKFEAWDD